MTRDELRVRNSRLAALGLEDYGAYIHSPIWRATRQRWHATYGKPPCVCGEPSVLLHHKTYQRLGEEALDDLVALCEDCHKTVHRLARAGLMSLDPQEFVNAELARRYREERAPAVERAKAELAADWKASPFGWDAKVEARFEQRRARGFMFKAQRQARRAAKEAAERDAA